RADPCKNRHVISLAERRKPRIMEPRNACAYPRGLPNLINRYVPRVLLLSCFLLSAQPAEDPQTQYNRGTGYWYGNGVPQEYAEAANWFRKAAERGYAEAQYRLGHIVSTGPSTLRG